MAVVLNQFPRPVVRTVIGDDNLHRAEVLATKSPKDLFQIAGIVIGGDNNP